MIRNAAKNLLLVLVVMATFACFATSYVATYLKDVGSSSLESGEDKVSPDRFQTPTVDKHTPDGVTVTAYPGAGKMVTGWWYYAAADTHDPICTGERVYTGNPIAFRTTEYLTTNLVAHLDYISYDLKYDTYGGTWSGSHDKKSVIYTNSVTVAESPTRTGYTFGGWRSSPREGTFSPDQVVTGADLCPSTWHEDTNTVTLTANWTVNGYSLNCETSGGHWSTGYAPPSSSTYDTVFSLPAPTRTGYVFQGWKVTENLCRSTARWGTSSSSSPSLPITADTLCVNGIDPVYFRNLNPTNDVMVELTAQWAPATILVTFNNMGASSGKESLSVTYDAAYIAVNTPTKLGSAFQGYVVNGEEYWDRNGQPKKSAWDIATNCTAIAQWDEIPYAIVYNENRTDGKSSKSQVVPFAYGEAVTLSDGTFEGGSVRFENFGCTLLGWSINQQASTPDGGCGLGEVKTFYESKTLYAVWEKNFFIAYDGNGATEGAMDVQKLVIDKSGQVLNANQYAKTGYEFLGWATNRAAAAVGDWKYADHAILPQDYAAVLGQTNTLVATWEANTYYLAFDPNGGTGTPLPVQLCRYDQPVSLPGCTYVNGAYDFIGWSNDVAKVIYTDLSIPVSNLCATAGGTHTLYAVWKLSDLSAAMECTNLRWVNVPFSQGADTDLKWQVARNGSNTWSCAQQEPAKASYPQTMTSSVITNSGTLTFFWRPEDGDGSFLFWIDEYGGEQPEFRPAYPTKKEVPRITGSDGVWVMVTTNFVINAGERKFIHLANDDFTSTISVDLMTWTPDSDYPMPVEGRDNAVISAASVVDGRFVLSFAGTNVFDYVLRTNADLQVKSWGEMMRTNGERTVTFEPPILPGLPQLFYKVETIQKK